MNNGLCYHYNSMWNATPFFPEKKENIKFEFVFFFVYFLAGE